MTDHVVVYSRKWNQIYEAVAWGGGMYRLVQGNYPVCFCYGRICSTYIVIGEF